MAYEYEAKELHSASIGYGDMDARDMPRSARVHEELEMLAKASHELREKIAQLDERLSCVMRPLPKVNPIHGSESDAKVPESACQVVSHLRGSREIVDETRRRIQYMLSALEI